MWFRIKAIAAEEEEDEDEDKDYEDEEDKEEEDEDESTWSADSHYKQLFLLSICTYHQNYERFYTN